MGVGLGTSQKISSEDGASFANMAERTLICAAAGPADVVPFEWLGTAPVTVTVAVS